VPAGADSDVEAQWHPSSALRPEPDGPRNAVREYRLRSPPRGRVSEAEAAETLAGRHYVVAGLVAQAAPMRLWRLRRSTHYPGPRPTPADLAYQDPGSPA